MTSLKVNNVFTKAREESLKQGLTVVEVRDNRLVEISLDNSGKEVAKITTNLVKPNTQASKLNLRDFKTN